MFASKVKHHIQTSTIWFVKRAYATPGKTKQEKQYYDMVASARKIPRSTHSLGAVADPYLPAKPETTQVYTFSGMQARLSRARKWFEKCVTLFRIRQKLGFANKSKHLAEQIAVPLYTQFKQAMAKQDVSELRNICTEHAFSDFKKEIKYSTPTTSNNNTQLQGIQSARVVHGTIVNLKDLILQNASFAQVTVRIQSLWTCNQQQQQLIDEYMVMERNLNDVSSQWRFAGVLDASRDYKVPTLSELVFAQQQSKN